MIFFETTCVEFLCVAGAHLAKIGGWFSQSRWLIFPESVTDFLKIDDGFPQILWQISSRQISQKSVADFLENPSLFLPRTEPALPKIGGWFSQSR